MRITVFQLFESFQNAKNGIDECFEKTFLPENQVLRLKTRVHFSIFNLSKSGKTHPRLKSENLVSRQKAKTKIIWDPRKIVFPQSELRFFSFLKAFKNAKNGIDECFEKRFCPEIRCPDLGRGCTFPFSAYLLLHKNVSSNLKKVLKSK